MRKIFITALAIILAASASWAAEVTLTWNNGDATAQTKIYYGQSRDSMTQSVVVDPGISTVTIKELEAGEEYFLQAAHVIGTAESEKSNGVFAKAKIAVPKIITLE